jgi:hypothetical protein
MSEVAVDRSGDRGGARYQLNGQLFVYWQGLGKSKIRGYPTAVWLDGPAGLKLL